MAQKLHWKIRLKTCIYPFLGLLLTGLSAALFSLSNVTVKWLKGVDPFTISFFRFLIIFALSIPSVTYSKVRKNVPLFPEGLAIIFIAITKTITKTIPIPINVLELYLSIRTMIKSVELVWNHKL